MRVHTSVVVLTYRRVPALLAVLRALATQADAGTEVLIADDGSRPDDVAAMTAGLPALPGPLWHVWHPDVGFTAARARNLAAARARGRYLVFLDGDCVPQARWLRHHAALAQPGQFVNGSRVLLSERLTRRVERGEVDPGRASLACKLGWRLNGDQNKWLPELPWPLVAMPHPVWPQFRWRGIRSCNFALWRGDFERVNGFDESFTGWGHEDADLVLRLHHAGLARCNAKWAGCVYHLWHRDNSRLAEQSNRQAVQARVGSGIVEAVQGLRQHGAADGVVLTRLA